MSAVAHWQWVAGTPVPNYSFRSLVAVYRCTHRGGAEEYNVFPASLPGRSRVPKNALCVGGLPNLGLSELLANRVDASAAKDAEFVAWLDAQGILYKMRPTAARMLESPDSLSFAQRAWLRGHIDRWRECGHNYSDGSKCPESLDGKCPRL